MMIDDDTLSRRISYKILLPKHFYLVVLILKNMIKSIWIEFPQIFGGVKIQKNV